MNQIPIKIMRKGDKWRVNVPSVAGCDVATDDPIRAIRNFQVSILRQAAEHLEQGKPMLPAICRLWDFQVVGPDNPKPDIMLERVPTTWGDKTGIDLCGLTTFRVTDGKTMDYKIEVSTGPFADWLEAELGDPGKAKQPDVPVENSQRSDTDRR